MEMEEMLLQLRAEVARLRELCSEQGRILRRLGARKGPVWDIPVSLPIQCTEDTVTGEGPRSPESHQSPPGAPTSSTRTLEGSAHPMEQPQAPSRLPPSPGNGVGSGGATAFGSTGGDKGDVPSWRSSWTLPVPQEGGRAPCSPQELETLNPGAGGSFPNLLDLYEAPEALGREGILPVQIRGPVKTSWTPGWALEEEGKLGSDASRAAAPGCDICQGIVTSEGAGLTEYLNHVLTHLE